ncbi:hypothetical protein [Blastococcus sp. URHD0036]|uniref:DUF7700 domain-containing protein n=1 Tax=Blastococcus sp. URHD0036 TaxID=1380356 RepID=UPI0012DF9970|nr:hypothetical protein [Blastococcus sp. URHD0036]
MGTTHHIQPIAPVEENTVRVPAGPVTFGLEMRELNPAIIQGFYADRPDAGAVRDLVDEGGEPDDGGASVHVFGTDDGLEYLRFDCFDKGPHYHYVHPHEPFQVVHEMDPVAFGDPFAWTVERLRGRLPEMLAESGGRHLGEAVDAAAVGRALDRLVELRAGLGQEVPA